jgi:ABC-type uncharacterized transport system permease subunit
MLPANVKRHLQIFSTIYSARLGKDFSLPIGQQTMQNLGSLCFFMLHLISFYFIIGKFSFPGWTRSDMWVLLFTFEIFTYLAFYLFWNGFVHTIRDINSGAFDLILAKPISSQFITFFRGGGSHNLLSVILASVFLVLIINKYNIPVSLLGMASYISSVALSLYTFLNLSICLISFNFKHGKISDIAYAGFQVQETYKYPATVYTGLKTQFWVVLACLSLLTTFPASVLLHKSLDQALTLIYFTFSLMMFLLSRLIWTRSLRHYSSASS